MEFKIKKSGNKRKSEPYYELTIEFMEGDADAYHKEQVIFDENEIDEAKPLILAVMCCNLYYQHGKGGFDDYNGYPFYDAFFRENISAHPEEYADYDYESEEDYKAMMALNPFDYYIEHPYGQHGIVTQFDGWSLSYFNENGDEFEVKVKLSEEEQAIVDREEKKHKRNY